MQNNRCYAVPACHVAVDLIACGGRQSDAEMLVQANTNRQGTRLRVERQEKMTGFDFASAVNTTSQLERHGTGRAAEQLYESARAPVIKECAGRSINRSFRLAVSPSEDALIAVYGTRTM
jgi:hypothetical protein